MTKFWKHTNIITHISYKNWSINCNKFKGTKGSIRLNELESENSLHYIYLSSLLMIVEILTNFNSVCIRRRMTNISCVLEPLYILLLRTMKVLRTSRWSEPSTRKLRGNPQTWITKYHFDGVETISIQVAPLIASVHSIPRVLNYARNRQNNKAPKIKCLKRFAKSWVIKFANKIPHFLCSRESTVAV